MKRRIFTANIISGLAVLTLGLGLYRVMVLLGLYGPGVGGAITVFSIFLIGWIRWKYFNNPTKSSSDHDAH